MVSDYFATARLLLATASAVACWVFVAIYHLSTCGDWRRSEHGVHLMAFTAGLGLIMTYVVAAIVGWVPKEWYPYASTGCYLIILSLVVWRIVLLLRAQRRN